MNQKVLDFFQQNYAPGRVCLIGSASPIYKLIRDGQSKLTKDGKPSKYNHTFLMGLQRDDGWGDGGIYTYESDLHISVTEWEVRNGVMESRIVKWCLDDLEYAAVLGINLTEQETNALMRKALGYAYDEQHLVYPVGELFGTLWAILTGKLNKRNVFDNKHAVQCATFVRTCYRDIQKEIVTDGTDLTNTSPEVISQSSVFTFRQEWRKI